MNRSYRWDLHFIRLAVESARMSKDPNTRVGAVIVGPDKEVRSMGFNGLPRGIADTEDRLQDREAKLELIVHGEMNAVLNAARIGVSTKGCTMYLAALEPDGLVWGGAPCMRCVSEIIQSGIVEIVCPPMKKRPSKWLESINRSKLLLAEAGVILTEIVVGDLW
jgi:dCMP deaminase